jgi:hypothetical protein
MQDGDHPGQQQRAGEQHGPKQQADEQPPQQDTATRMTSPLQAKLHHKGFVCVDRLHTGEALVMEGFTEHAFVNREFKPVRPPENFMSVVDKHFSK